MHATVVKIAVVGAPGTGKTTLVHALRQALFTGTASADCVISEDWAPDHHHQNDLTLLMGLDLPKHHATTEPSLLQKDARLRQVLNSHSITYAVVYGSGQARTDCALQAIDYHRRQLIKQPLSATLDWHWNCETCSDAQCEHRLFSALVNKANSVRQ